MASEVGRFNAEVYCIVFCMPHSDVVAMTSNIASEDVAAMHAKEIKGRGGHVFAVVPAGVLVAALEIIKKKGGA